MNSIILLIFGCFFGNFVPTPTVDIKVTVTNIETFKGNMQLGVFNSPKSFLTKGKEFKTFSQKVTGNSITFIIKDLPADNYAISVYHDKNSDNKCNLNFLGIPVEPYGFSKNFKPTLRKPKFEECEIEAKNNSTISIALIN